MRLSTNVLKRSEPHWSPQAWRPVDLAPSAAAAAFPAGRYQEGAVPHGQAEEIVARAQEQAAAVMRQAREEGLAAAEREAAHMLQAARTIYDDMLTWRETALAESEGAVLDLVADIARRLFGQGVQLSEEALRETFADALERAKALGDLRIRLNPEDARRLQPLWPSENDRRLEWIPDAAILPGGCLIEGQAGTLDARVEVKLDRVLEALADVSPDPAEVDP